jgi:hypothetical protein
MDKFDIHHSSVRRFPKIPREIRVEVRYVREGSATETLPIYEGATAEFDATGMILWARLPSSRWLSELLATKMLLAVTFDVPGDDAPVEVRARVAWVEAFDRETFQFRLGLVFEKISDQDSARIKRFLASVPNPG